jgi:hypothetical protein
LTWVFTNTNTIGIIYLIPSLQLCPMTF